MTIKDLAAQTGYSVGTISRVLNNQPHVSDLAREIILKAAEESGFQLNENARQLKQQQSNSRHAAYCGNQHREQAYGYVHSCQPRQQIDRRKRQ